MPWPSIIAEADLSMAMRIVPIIAMGVEMGILVGLVAEAIGGPASKMLYDLCGLYIWSELDDWVFDFVDLSLFMTLMIKILDSP